MTEKIVTKLIVKDIIYQSFLLYDIYQHFAIGSCQILIFVDAFKIRNTNHLDGAKNIVYRLLFIGGQGIFTVIAMQYCVQYCREFVIGIFYASLFGQYSRSAIARVP